MSNYAVSSTKFPSMADQDPKEEFVCPYNKYHVITAQIYPTHVANCRKMHTGPKFGICSFNQRHHMPEELLEQHESSTCPDRKRLEYEMNSVPAPNVPVIDHRSEPVYHEGEDWEEEAQAPQFSLHGEEEVDQYDMIEQFQHELQIKNENVSSSSNSDNLTVNGNLTKAHKKNWKRAQKRREKRSQEASEVEGRNEVENEVVEENVILNRIAEAYGVQIQNISFVDWVSILNQYCQKNKINPPKYSESSGGYGSFGAQCVVGTERYFSKGLNRSKKDAKHSAARVALLGLNVVVSAPDPCRAPYQARNHEKSRKLEENKGLLLETIKQNQSNQPQNIPGYNPDDEWQVVGRKRNDNLLRHAGVGRGRRM